jgi:6-phosphogluconolactonase (cycloisomerase 2 family)
MRATARSIRLVLACLLATALPTFAAQGEPGAVYVADNSAAGNAVMVFARQADGRLGSPPELVSTGGLGTGTGLGNQGGVVLSADRRHLFVVNAGSDDVSVFRVEPNGLQLLGVTPSGGQRPVSLAHHGGLLYALNAGGVVGGEDSIAGFRFHNGALEPLPGSIQPLSAASTDPAQIAFNAQGSVLIVSEKATHTLTTFRLDASGVADVPLPQASVGETPFGFAVSRQDEVLVSEAFGGAPDASAVTSYRVDGDGLLQVLAPSVATTETAACWVVISKNGRFAYTTNTGSASVTGFAIAPDGGLTLLDPDGVTGTTGAGPIDMGLSVNGRNLYTLNSGGGTLTVFRVRGRQGGLKALQTVSGLPDGANGLAAH